MFRRNALLAFASVVLLGVGAGAAYEATARTAKKSDCCATGASCCKPGASCCETGGDCCYEGAECCVAQLPCCASAK